MDTQGNRVGNRNVAQGNMLCHTKDTELVTGTPRRETRRAIQMETEGVTEDSCGNTRTAIQRETDWVTEMSRRETFVEYEGKQIG